MEKMKKLKWKKVAKGSYESHPKFIDRCDFDSRYHEFKITFKNWGERKFWMLMYDTKTILYMKTLSSAKKIAQLIIEG